MSGAIEALIFDLDGVLVDSEPLHWRASHRLFAPHELTMEEYEPFVGLAIEPYMAWARERFGLDATVEELIERYAESVTAEIESAPIPALDGARELIAAARERGLRVGLASQSIAELGAPHAARREPRRLVRRGRDRRRRSRFRSPSPTSTCTPRACSASRPRRASRSRTRRPGCSRRPRPGCASCSRGRRRAPRRRRRARTWWLAR